MKFVNDNLLKVIKQNNIFPQDIDITKTTFIHFGKCGLTVIKLINSGEYIKHLNYWGDMSAEQINNELNTISWEKQQ